MELMPRVAAAWEEHRSTLSRLVELIVLLVIVSDFVRVVARIIGIDGPLVWDEAVYAVHARGWTDAEAPAVGWDYIRPPLLPLISIPAILAGGDEWMLRLVGLAAGAGLLVLVWLLGRIIVGPLAGIAAAAVLYASPTLQWHSGLALTDVLSAALLVALMVLLWRELQGKEQPGPGLSIAAVVASAAFLTRYGAVAAIAPILLMSVALWWRKIIRWPRWPLIAVMILAVVALAHAAWSISQTGSPLGVLSRSREIVPEWEWSPPFAMFQQWITLELAGTVGRLCVVVGFVAVPIAAAISLVDERWHATLRGVTLVATVGISQVVLLVSGVAHVEQRYFVFAIAALVLAGACIAARLAMMLPVPFRIGLAVALGVFVVANRGPSVDLAFERTVAIARYYEPSRLIGEEIARQAETPCGVVGAGDNPIISWYSGCDAVPLSGSVGGASPATLLNGEDPWLLAYAKDGQIDTSDPALQAALAHVLEPATEIRDPVDGELIAVIWPLKP
jgi:4-amino-4-deoxy-L-arabinose transferase-like glycosyltransferase